MRTTKWRRDERVKPGGGGVARERRLGRRARGRALVRRDGIGGRSGTALTILGGAGITIYLAAWLLIPERGADRSIAERVWAARHRSPLSVYAAVLLAMLVVACSPHAVAVGALLVGAFLLWHADRRPGTPAPR